MLPMLLREKKMLSPGVSASDDSILDCRQLKSNKTGDGLSG